MPLPLRQTLPRPQPLQPVPAPRTAPPLPPPETVGEHLSLAARRQTEASAVVDQGSHLRWPALDATSDQLACGLMGLKLQRGDCIAALVANRAEWLVLFCAASKLGVAVLALSAEDDDAALLAQLQDSQARALFVLQAPDAVLASRLRQLVTRAPLLRHLIADDDSGLNSLAALAATPLEVGRLSAARRRVLADDTALLLPGAPVANAAGTAAERSTAVFSHRQLLARAGAQAAHSRAMGHHLLQPPRALAQPLVEAGRLHSGVIAHLLGGGTVVLQAGAAAGGLQPPLPLAAPAVWADQPAPRSRRLNSDSSKPTVTPPSGHTTTGRLITLG